MYALIIITEYIIQIIYCANYMFLLQHLLFYEKELEIKHSFFYIIIQKEKYLLK